MKYRLILTLILLDFTRNPQDNETPYQYSQEAHMKKPLLALAFLLLAYMTASNAQWRCLYATYDDDSCDTCNATGHNTIGVGLIKQDMFVALVMTRGVRCFMIPYVNADSAHGRRYTYGYGSATSGIYQVWSDGGFDQVQMSNAFSIVATPDSVIYVANNDVDHNILVFKFINDTITVVSPFPRTTTGSNSIYGLALDASKRVYVCNDTTTGQSQDIKIYRPAAQWDPNHLETPIRTIDLPDGIYKGIVVTPDGGSIFVSDFSNRRVRKYVGSPTTGYTLSPTFGFQLTPRDTIPFSGGRVARPIGLGHLTPNNILAVTADSLFGLSGAYSYGRIYFVNPNTGALISSDTSISMIDCAQWNFAMTGGYNLRPGGTVPGNASGYASVYDVKFDQQGYLYTQSYYGWTIDKWRYNGTLPTITSVQEVGGTQPESYILKQNYPNPFNPTTNIDFSLLKSGYVSLRVYDILGKEIVTLVDEQKNAGNYKVTFDARDLPSGTYFYTLRSGGFSQTKRMLFIK
jgi:hypothetical protein